jgi:hypothetical protein
MDDVSDYSRFDVEDAQIMINSASRDMTAYPDASNYTIDFSSAPFKLVVGVFLLSASIPRSGYVVDGGKNVLRFAVGNPPYEAANVRTANVTPGDYNLPQLCDQLSEGLGRTGITVMPATNPAEISNKMAFFSPEPFSLVLDHDTLGGKMGFGRSVNQADIAAGYYSGTDAWKERNFIDSNVYVSSAVASNAIGYAFVGPRPFADSIPLYAANVLSQRFTVLTSGFAANLTLSVPPLAVDTTFLATVKSPTGNVLSTGYAKANAADTTVFVPFDVRVAPMELLSQKSASTIEIAVSADCSVYVNPPNVPLDAANSISRGTSKISDSLSVCATLAVYKAGYRVYSPGVVDLTGDRFLTVRCPEIESYLVHSERMSSAAIHPGIGLLSLGTYGYSESQLDFYNYKPRTLSTPIGRLTKLTITLESQDGSEYPTRGCDHTLLLNVRYLVPKKVAHRPGEVGSILSPGYTSDVWKYAVNTDVRARPGNMRRVIGH